MTPLQQQRKAYQQLLDKGFTWLKFPKDIEHRFQESLFHHLKFRYNLLSVITIGMLLFYSVGDYLLLPEAVHEHLIPIRLFILIPVISLSWWASQKDSRPDHFNFYLSSLYVFFGLSIIYMIYFAETIAFILPYEGLYICIMYGYLLLSLPFLLTIALSTFIFAAYLVMVTIVTGDSHTLIFNGSFLLSANFIGAVGCYIHEYQVRKNYLGERILAMSNEIAEIDSQRQMRFLATASHDLRQPLHALSLFTESLKQSIHQPELLKTLNNIDLSTQNLSTQLNSLLDISRLSLGRVEINKIPIALCYPLSQIGDEYQTIATQKGIKLSIHCNNAQVMSDPLLLDRIIRNLLDNAIKHADASKILIGLRYRKDHWLLEVRDNGKGIAQVDQSRIFEEFQQLNNPNRDEKKGLGLGLSTVSYLSNNMGHPLTLESSEGKGCCFRIKLDKASNNPLQIPRPEKPKNTNYRLLLLDNDHAVLDGMIELVRGWGYTVLGVSSVNQALEYLQDNKADMLLTDYRLDSNQMNGLELSRYIHENINETFPIIMITGDTQPELEEEADDEGIMLLHKPLSPNTLITLLNTLLP